MNSFTVLLIHIKLYDIHCIIAYLKLFKCCTECSF